jgi:hypothetical protein
MTSTVKRTRFDASALCPSDKAATPMASARLSLQTHCASLQPEIASILSKLGSERLQVLHKLSHKSTQAKKIEDDPEFIPRSARVNFALSASKLVEQDAEYTRLVDETSTLVTTFQSALKTKILAIAQLEVSTLQKQLRSDFATSIRLAVKACLICEQSILQLDVDQVVNTLLQEYSTQLLAHLDMDLGEFRALYKRTHTLTTLPATLTLVIPTTPHPQQAVALPSQATLLAFAKVHRTLDTTFLTPWSVYLDVQTRNDISIQIKKLGDTHFASITTEATAMLVDSEGAVEPTLLKDFIQTQVTSATRALQSELKTLRSQLSAKPPTKNSSRGTPRASLKKKTGNRAAAAPSDSDAAKSKQTNSARSKRTSKKPSQPKPGASNRRKKTSPGQSQ